MAHGQNGFDTPALEDAWDVWTWFGAKEIHVSPSLSNLTSIQ